MGLYQEPEGGSVTSTDIVVYDVTDYGLTGDGVTNDGPAYAALGALVVATGLPATVYFPSGTYILNTTYDWADTWNIHIKGDGPEETTLDFSATAINGIYRQGTGSSCIGVKIKCQAAKYAMTYADSTIDVHPYTFIWRNCKVDGGVNSIAGTNIYVSDIIFDQTGGASGNCIWMSIGFSTMENCYITGYDIGMLLYSVSYCCIRNIRSWSNTTNFRFDNGYGTKLEGIYPQYGTNQFVIQNVAANYRNCTLTDYQSGTAGITGAAGCTFDAFVKIDGYTVGSTNRGNMNLSGKTNKRTATATDYDILESDYMIGVTSTAAARAIRLMSGTVRAGRTYIVKDESGACSANNITVSTEGAETIDGAASIVMSTDYQTVRLYCDGTNWFTF